MAAEYMDCERIAEYLSNKTGLTVTKTSVYRNHLPNLKSRYGFTPFGGHVLIKVDHINQYLKSLAENPRGVE